MAIAFQVLLMLIVVISFMGAIGSKEKEQRLQMVSVNIASIIAMVVTFLFI